MLSKQWWIKSGLCLWRYLSIQSDIFQRCALINKWLFPLKIKTKWKTSIPLFFCELIWLFASFERASQVSQWWRICLPMQEMQETQVQSLSQDDPLEKKMATHSTILAWEIPHTDEPGQLQSMGLRKVGHDWATKNTCVRAHTHTHTHTHYLKNWALMQICLWV